MTDKQQHIVAQMIGEALAHMGYDSADFPAQGFVKICSNYLRAITVRFNAEKFQQTVYARMDRKWEKVRGVKK